MSTAQRTVELSKPIDLLLSYRLQRFGPSDPTMIVEPRRVVRAFEGPTGPLTVAMANPEDRAKVRVQAWGPDAEWALAHAPAWLGVDDDDSTFAPSHPKIIKLRRDLAGLRLVQSPSVFDMLTRLILQQRVAWRDAARSFRLLTQAYGQPAPGPFPSITTALGPATWRRIPPPEFNARGVEAKRARPLRDAAVSARRIEETRGMTFDAANARLRAFRGIGVWTAQGVLGYALGAPDAVQAQDYDLPRLVSVVLTGQPRADDARMLALLAPFAGHRFRVIRLMLESGTKPPRFGPRRARPAWETHGAKLGWT